MEKKNNGRSLGKTRGTGFRGKRGGKKKKHWAGGPLKKTMMFNSVKPGHFVQHQGIPFFPPPAGLRIPVVVFLGRRGGKKTAINKNPEQRDPPNWASTLGNRGGGTTIPKNCGGVDFILWGPQPAPRGGEQEKKPGGRTVRKGAQKAYKKKTNPGAYFPAIAVSIRSKKNIGLWFPGILEIFCSEAEWGRPGGPKFFIVGDWGADPDPTGGT